MNESRSSSGIGILAVLQIVFLVLKLTGLIDWSWWWVLSPFILNVVIIIIALLVILICMFIEHASDRRRW